MVHHFYGGFNHPDGGLSHFHGGLSHFQGGLSHFHGGCRHSPMVAKAIQVEDGDLMKRTYGRFAQVYDQMEADRHSIRMVDYCYKLFDHFDIRPQYGLDLCCGTGTALKLFAERGLVMAGLDQSASMLTMAARKLKRHQATLYQKSLPRFKLRCADNSRRLVKFDLVTCFYDSLNYMLSERDLRASFRSVFTHLERGGWFIFDMNTPLALKTIWDEQVYAGTRKDMAWVWENEYLPQTKTAICHATFFVKKGRHWERFYEQHTERAYSNTVVRRLLRESGFRIKGFFRCYTLENAVRQGYRICVVAKRPS